MNQIKHFLSGLKIIPHGVRFIWKNKPLLLWSLIPIFINLSMIVLLFSLSFGLIEAGVASALGLLFTPPYSWVYYLVYYPMYLLLALGFAVVTIYVSFVIASVLASPVYSILAEKTIQLSHGVTATEKSLSSVVKTSIKMFRVSLIKTMFFIPIGAFIFIFSFVPILNLFASFLAFLIISFDAFDFSFEAGELNFGKRISYLKENFTTLSGLALSLGLTLFIPGLTLLVMPASVVGAALWFAERAKLGAV